MRINGLKDEVFNDFKTVGMYISVPFCSVRCWERLGLDKSICQNSHLDNVEIKNIPNKVIIDRYLKNEITKCIIFSGRDSMDSFEEILEFVGDFREVCKDDIVLYTGRNEDEIQDKLTRLKEYENIWVKVGNYIPNNEGIIDPLTGIKLASDNQKFIKIGG